MEENDGIESQENKTLVNSHAVVIAISVCIVTALVVGFGVYAWQQSVMTKSQMKLQQQLEALQKQSAITPALLSHIEVTSIPRPMAKDAPNAEASLKSFTDTDYNEINFKYPSNLVISQNSDGLILINDPSGNKFATLTLNTGSYKESVAYVSNPAHNWFKSEPVKTMFTTDLGVFCTKMTGLFGSAAGSINSKSYSDFNNLQGTTYICEGSLPRIATVVTEDSSLLDQYMRPILNTLEKN
ncbi:MAG: hypothetical protein ABIP54_04835 [Candidatus Andersenbacteria bacterium]